jgi:hypothetical protein
MASAADLAPVDPLERDYAPERVNYATGVLLQADDFQAEQTYHRGRLAQFARHLLGFGTLAGLRVIPPAATSNLLELRVEPGIAIDRFGRLIEVQSAQCIQLARWLDAQDDAKLRAATHDAPRTALPQAVVADVFLSAHACGRGKTPSFASGPFDALDALVAARLAENPQLTLVLRLEGNVTPDDGAPPATEIPSPANSWPTATATATDKLDAVLGSWDIGAATNADQTLTPLQEHVRTEDPSAILLARIAIPVTMSRAAPGTAPPVLDTGRRVLVDNALRPFIYFPGKWFGRALAVPPAP